MILKVWPLILFAAVACTREKKTEEKHQFPETLTQEVPSSAVKAGKLEQSLQDQGLVNIQVVDSTLLVDLKYSSTDNFFGADVYGDLTNAYLPEDVAIKLKRANELLKLDYPDYRLLIFDAVRPHGVQQILWRSLDSIPPMTRKAYVADPAEGSLHNYGCAIDLSVYNLKADSLLDMGTSYDYFGDLAYPRKEEMMLAAGLLTEKQVNNRELLRNVMIRAGFSPITSEWWHFNSTSLAAAKRNYPRIE